MSILRPTCIALALSICASTALAGPVERACNRSDRPAATPAVCACIQQVADITLTGADQRKAAKLMNDPDRAHEVWLSKSASDDAFWDRYKGFGDMAEAYCRQN